MSDTDNRFTHYAPVEITVVYDNGMQSPVRIYPVGSLPAFVLWAGKFYGKTDERGGQGCVLYRKVDHIPMVFLVGYTF